ncbi:sulfotransferase [Sphingobium sp.]|uniref:sulfotransferase family protein n=1 Tax=Sphingobium sp. TaxID=1912891 RepID=UPI0028BE89AB|nr:sulfotransferase [Sphingobium sp.]
MTGRSMVEEREQKLHAEAVERVGHDDFGEPTYRAGLRVVLEALDDDPGNAALANAIERHALDALTGRLYAEAGWKAYPSCLDTKLAPPLVITGLPRTGTSILHQLLCTDPQFQWMPNWIAAAPRPRPPREEWSQAPEYLEAHRRLDEQFKANPGVRAAHNVEAMLPEECIRLMIQSFVTMRFISTLPLPRYEKWFFEQDEVPSYRRFADNLRLIGKDCPLPWLLKNPSHSMGIEALLTVFPDARIVITHRDPIASIASGASTIQRSAGSLWSDQNAIGPHRLRIWSRAARRLEAARKARPNQFVEIEYDRILADPIGATTDIYERFGLEQTSQTVTAMRDWLASNPQGKHGKHEYRLQDTGLTAEAIAAELSDYQLRYGYA